MNVLLISQCSKNALTETRRVLDQFAERRGDRTWQTPITWEGLVTLRKLLKKTARKNTAVACHWIRGKDHSELLWVVGDVGRFNAEGAVPTNTTSRNILRKEDENEWHTLEALSLMAAIAGLFHDFGKANKLFQDKLNPRKKTPKNEPLRHEWVSLRLFQAFIGNLTDHEWLEKLRYAGPHMEKDLLEKLEKDSGTPRAPFAGWAARPLALTTAWLIVSHHRLPVFPAKEAQNPPYLDDIPEWLTYDFNAGWNSPQLYDQSWSAKDWEEIWNFPNGTPLTSNTWCRKAQSLAKRALRAYSLKDYRGLDDLYTSHLARMVLMLADHIYSARPPTGEWQDKSYKVYANTDRETRRLKQKLDEHNVGVGHHAYLLAKQLPELQRRLPAITRVKTLKKRTTLQRFRWQDKAFDLASGLAQRSEKQGFFGINLASTGCGKTFTNARIIYGLANERRGCRFNVALGLRTLTLQTGDALAEMLQLGKEDLAVLVGSQAVKDLHQQGKPPHEESTSGKPTWEQAGSESAQALIDDDLHVHYEGTLDDSHLSGWLKTAPKLHQLVSAPVLVSTIDYLMPATEGARGGRQIAPMLRLLTSDLVLDEPDDFALEDLPALCRLVHWAGLLGSRVLLSSATLPPALVEALFSAYQAGRKQYRQARNTHHQDSTITCAWFDEFDAKDHSARDSKDFAAAHERFVQKRIQRLDHSTQTRAPLRWAALLPIAAETRKPKDIVLAMARSIHGALLKLHHEHKQPGSGAASGKQVSFGLIRMANINPLVAIAQKLLEMPLPSNHRLHFCIYHGQYPLLMRSRIESILDRMLDRNQENAVWSDPTLIEALNTGTERHHIFIVLGSPVTEVGRDHDYDWAIAEPSSIRSLIQLAGRIQRHRQQPPGTPNLLILDKNFKALKGEPRAYMRPGFESEEFQLKNHDLAAILTREQYEYISAIPRLLSRKKPDPHNNLSDLEHAHLTARLFGSDNIKDYAALWWQENATWTQELQRRTPFRKSSPEELLVLYQEDELDELKFHLWTETGELINQHQCFTPGGLETAERVSPWIDTRPEQLINEQVEKLDDEPANICKRFMQIRLRAEQRWLFHPLLGVYKPLENRELPVRQDK